MTYAYFMIALEVLLFSFFSSSLTSILFARQDVTTALALEELQDNLELLFVKLDRVKGVKKVPIYFIKETKQFMRTSFMNSINEKGTFYNKLPHTLKNEIF